MSLPMSINLLKHSLYRLSLLIFKVIKHLNLYWLILRVHLSHYYWSSLCLIHLYKFLIHFIQRFNSIVPLIDLSDSLAIIFQSLLFLKLSSCRHFSTIDVLGGDRAGGHRSPYSIYRVLNNIGQLYFEKRVLVFLNRHSGLIHILWELQKCVGLWCFKVLSNVEIVD